MMEASASFGCPVTDVEGLRTQRNERNAVSPRCDDLKLEQNTAAEECMKKDSAHTVPTQCPHSAHTVPTQCPLEFYNISRMVAVTKAFYIRMKIRILCRAPNVAKLEWALCGHCVGTVRALCGHCVGTGLSRLMREHLLRGHAHAASDGRQTHPHRQACKKRDAR